VGDGYWSWSGCRSDVQWYGFPGQGAYYNTARFGTHWVGPTHSTYHDWGYECGALGAPVKDYEYLTEFAAAGQWFEGGAIYYKNGGWHVALGNFGQTAGRLTADVGEWPVDAELPPGHSLSSPPEPAIPAETSHREP
jgi:hypothetical protein